MTLYNTCETSITEPRGVLSQLLVLLALVQKLLLTLFQAFRFIEELLFCGLEEHRSINSALFDQAKCNLKVKCG
jgi:hypothetical protein